MKAIALLATLSLMTTLAGCSAEQPGRPAPQAAHGTVDPSIPAVTITARRMSASEKLAYDRSLTANVAGLKTGN